MPSDIEENEHSVQDDDMHDEDEYNDEDYPEEHEEDYENEDEDYEDNGPNAIISAIFGSNLKKVRLLLDSKVNVNQNYNNNMTALHYSIQSDCSDISKLLIERGANVFVGNSNMAVPAQELLKKGDIQLLEAVAKANDLNTVDESGSSMLVFAVKECELEVVKFLLEHKAEANQEVNGDTALGLACEEGLEPVVQLLLQHKADANQLSCDRAPLAWAAMNQHVEIMQLLLNHKADVNSDALLLAAQHAVDPAVVQLLLSNKANVNQVNKLKETPLYLAAAAGRTDNVSLLLKSKANPKLKTKAGLNAHDVAVLKERQQQIIDLLS